MKFNEIECGMILDQNLDNEIKYTQFRSEDYDNDNNLNIKDVTENTTTKSWKSDIEFISVEVEEISGSEDEMNLGKGRQQQRRPIRFENFELYDLNVNMNLLQSFQETMHGRSS